MDKTNKNGNGKSLTLTERAKRYRQVRRDAGLVEVKIWVRQSDREKVDTLLEPFTQSADATLRRNRINNAYMSID